MLAILPLATSAIAQKRNHHEIGIWMGAANYFGDLQSNPIPWGTPQSNTYQLSGGINYKYFVNPHIGFRFGASLIRISGADSLSEVTTNRLRNLSFHNNLFETSGAIELNFLPIDRESRFKFTPYIFAGVGAVFSNPYAFNDAGDKIKLRDLGTEGQGLANYPDRKLYPVLNASFPLGGGFKFLVGDHVMISTEVGLRYTSTDYLDDVSRSYVNMDTLLAYRGQQAVEMSYRGNTLREWDNVYPNYTHQRGDFNKNDWYWTVGLNVNVYFDAFGNVKEYIQAKCPRWLRGKRKY